MALRRPPSGNPIAAGPDVASSIRLETIRTLNDLLREGYPTGHVYMTRGVSTLPLADRLRVMLAVQLFDAFDTANDPYGEHDLGTVEYDGVTYLWKIDYLDQEGLHGSPDPADPEVTLRALTIMRADEY